jgi:hypothetical protein
MEESLDKLGFEARPEIASLMREVAAAQRAELAHAELRSQVRQGLAARMKARERRWLPPLRFALPALGAVGTAAVAAAWWTLAPLSFAVGSDQRAGQQGERVASAGASVPLAFSDGTAVAVDPGAELEVLEVDGRGATLEVKKGRVRLDVQKRLRSRWHVRAGKFDVNVTGTRFTVDWKPDGQALTVTMQEGAVEVSAPQLAGSSPVRVTAGQRFFATARASRWELGSATSPPAPATPAAPEPPAEAPVARSWQELARDGQYPEALAAAEASGFDDACRRLGIEDLVLLGDVARLARQPGRAVQAYKEARRRFPGADRPVFALGLVAFEQQRDFRAAAHWFDTYLRRHPGGPLAREAAGRALESWHRAGDITRSRRAARSYLRRTPAGPYAPLAKQIAGS